MSCTPSWLLTYRYWYSMILCIHVHIYLYSIFILPNTLQHPICHISSMWLMCWLTPWLEWIHTVLPRRALAMQNAQKCESGSVEYPTRVLKKCMCAALCPTRIHEKIFLLILLYIFDFDNRYYTYSITTKMSSFIKSRKRQALRQPAAPSYSRSPTAWLLLPRVTKTPQNVEYHIGL